MAPSEIRPVVEPPGLAANKLCDVELVKRRAHPANRCIRALWLTPAARLVVT